MKAQQRKRDEQMDEMKKMFPKHLYETDAEESDYELTDKDMHPPNPHKRASS